MLKMDYFLNKLSEYQEVCWKNPYLGDKSKQVFTIADIEDASNRLQRFSAYVSTVFPETKEANGIIESELVEIPTMLSTLEQLDKCKIDGKLYLKCDNNLPVSGSIKARGGIYEVLKYAETVALKTGKLKEEDNYAILAEPEFIELFSKYSLAVGSTGNLGLSIGIMGAKLGFQTTVHMSNDAKEWKKELLRSKGVVVIEHKGSFSTAVEKGRKEAEKDSLCYFVDDENSNDLFLGYSVAAFRLQNQLVAQQIDISKEKPLFIYLPCGIGGSPGGIAFGLKMIFGDNVNIIFVEPTHSPCMLLGLYTQLHDKISVHDIGINGKTSADGLAVGRASGLVSSIIRPLLYAATTVTDDRMYEYLTLLADSENIYVEPSSTTGFAAFVDVNRRLSRENPILNVGTHIVWGTGGNMVPESEMNNYYEKGKSLLYPHQ